MALPGYKEIIELVKAGATIDAQEKIMELRQAALDQQEENIRLRQQMQTLEAQLKARDEWEAEKKRYLLVNPWQGPAQAYALRQDAADGEQPHLLCANCFLKERKEILAPIRDQGGWVQTICSACNTKQDTGFRGIGKAEFAEAYLRE
ncbi:MAG: hypothetical protein R3270_03575 [Gammaproteobacteria bacterium]|nr:hypothetical protein [Gammaproteobacteria bacterium]